jgi:hypothetical protein
MVGLGSGSSTCPEILPLLLVA